MAAMPKVLVVDDSLSVRKVVERTLEARQMKVVSAALGIEAIERIERDQPDLVVCDVLLPDKDGYEVCEFVKAHPRLSRTPVLLMSGIVNESVLDRAAQVRSDEVMRKPFAADELARKVDDLLSRGAAVSDPVAEQAGAATNGVGVVLPLAAPPPAAPVAPAGPVLTEPASPAAPTSPAPIDPVTPVAPTGSNLQDILTQFIGAPGARHAVLADREGFLIASVGELGPEAEAAAALAACLAESAGGLGVELGQGALGGVILEYEGGSLLLHTVGPAALLTLVLKDPAALGKVRYVVKKALAELARAL